jgi:hypothetical protein
MTEQFVPYEITQILIEKGFKEQCLAYYQNQTLIINALSNYELDKYKLGIPAPLWQQAIDWLRDVKKLEIIVESGHVDLGYSYHIYYTKDGKSRRMDGFGHDELEEVEYDYPEARQKAIEQALTLI